MVLDKFGAGLRLANFRTPPWRAVAKTPADPYVMPSEETVRSGAYPVSRPLFLYLRGAPQGLAKAFLDFVASSEGQQIVRRIDFVPVAGAPQ